DLEQLIKELAQEYQSQIKLIQTVPGFKKELTSIRLISEIGVDMTKFPTSGHLCSWAGVVPANNESAGKKHSTKISKGGRYLKPLLVQVANAVVRSETHPEIRNKYLQLKKRRGHKKAIIAIAHRLLVAIYHVLLNKEPYNPDLYHVTNYIPPDKELSIEEAIQFAKSHGFKIA
ncbi:transposase, partial [Siminovitchia sp. 179-K 8D1 HS]|uniref:transposase n=1 Tax=Siminovitchia sp. 179-K 8D1 HS TaxID=3142385 RepID=UPI0039A14357